MPLPWGRLFPQLAGPPAPRDGKSPEVVPKLPRTPAIFCFEDNAPERPTYRADKE
jgi:hypothetical protein